MMGAALMLTSVVAGRAIKSPSQPKATPREIWQSLVSGGIWALSAINGGLSVPDFSRQRRQGGVARPFLRRGISIELTFSSLNTCAGQCRQNDVSRSGGRVPCIRPLTHRGITHDGVRFAAAAGRLLRDLYLSSHDSLYRVGGDGFDANGVNFCTPYKH